jgi:hypothetical protein
VARTSIRPAPYRFGLTPTASALNNANRTAGVTVDCAHPAPRPTSLLRVYAGSSSTWRPRHRANEAATGCLRAAETVSDSANNATQP